MDRAAAEREILAIFGKYGAASQAAGGLPSKLTDGKVYELYVLAQLLEELAGRGFGLSFTGTSLKFKASPGRINTADPHFEVTKPGDTATSYRIFVDIEFDTFGHTLTAASDNSQRHEIDILVTTSSGGYPGHKDIALGIECKAVANFGKGLLKEALGVRRELGSRAALTDSVLTTAGGSPAVQVPMDPPSEYWLAFIDGKGLNYAQSPGAYGITLHHLEP